MKKTLTLLFIFSYVLFYAQPHQLEVEGSVSNGIERALILEHNMDTGSHGFTSFLQYAGSGDTESLGGFITYNPNYAAIPDFAGYVTILSGSSTKLGRGINLIGSSPSSNVRFYIGGAQANNMKMILSSDGFLGIGNTNPAAKIHVTDGDVYIEDINKGVIMKSPNGTCWRLTVDDTGAMIPTALISCP